MTNLKPPIMSTISRRGLVKDFCRISNKRSQNSGVDHDILAAVGASALGADRLPVDEECRPRASASSSTN